MTSGGDLFGDRTDLGDDLMDFVLRHTEGNPFLVTQLMRTMVEESVFHYTGAAWEWSIPAALTLPAGNLDAVAVPPPGMPATDAT